MKLIINADDFGISRNVNQAICDCFGNGHITNTTVMVNMPYFAEAVLLSKEKCFSEKCGLHINLYEGMPLTDEIKKYPVFCNTNGELEGLFRRNIKTQFVLNKEEQRVLSNEMEAQINRYIDCGFTQMHCDSHGHSHTNYSIYHVLKPLLMKYGFRTVRAAENINRECPASKKIYKKVYNTALAKEFKTTKFFSGFANGTMYLNKNTHKTVEFMCHPSIQNGEVVNIGCPISFRDVLEKFNNCELISYCEVC